MGKQGKIGSNMQISNLGFLAGALGSVGYFQLSESTVPKDSNCSYLAPISTDILAIIAGGILAYRGHRSNDPYVSFVGGCVLGIHAQQWMSHKGG